LYVNVRVARDGVGTKNITLVVFSIKESRMVRRLFNVGDVIANGENRVMAKSGTGVAVKQGDIVTTVIIANGTKDACLKSCDSR
jgi:ribosomal protein L14